MTHADSIAHQGAGEQMKRLAISEARALAQGVWQKLRYSAEDAAILADHVIDAELCGYGYSGLAKILNVAADPLNELPRRPITVVKETPCSALLDGGNNVGMLGMYRTTEVAIAKAKQSGIVIAGAYDTFVSGRNAYYLEMAANADLLGIHMGSARPKVAPPGGTRPRLGTNPIAFGVPSARGPIIFDMGTAAVMGSDLMLRARLNQLLPENVAIDASGAPTRDPRAAEQGSILTFGGFKGFGLSFFIQAFGLLAGAASSDKKHYGFLLVLIDPSVLVPLDVYKREVAELFDFVKNTPRQPGVEQIRIPSERAFREREARLEAGEIFVEAAVYEQLNAILNG